MKYQGSKNRHAKDLLSVILHNRKPNQYYVEPFCGGCNMIDKVEGNRIANDSHKFLIDLFESVIYKNVNLPDSITDEEYNNIKNNKSNFPSYLVGFVGFGCSYSGKWFGGYARSIKGKVRNYCDESKRNILKQSPYLKGVIFENKSYLDLDIPKDSIVYCDPPYENTTGYKSKFNHIEFWDWVRNISKKHQVFISEYNAPSDFICLWEKSVNNTLEKDTGKKKGFERLFTFNG